MNTCCCLSPACQVYGCQNAMLQRQEFGTPLYRPIPMYAPHGNPPDPAYQPAAPLTVDDVRRIVREEIEKAKP